MTHTVVDFIKNQCKPNGYKLVLTQS